ncbi:MAG: hypothetical protein V3T42_10460, partial [Nitrospirales bacterium]
MESSLNTRRQQALVSLIGRAERMEAQGTTASRCFSRWRVGIFLTGAVTCVGFYQHAWFHTGNLALIIFLTIFLTITWFHQR